MLGDPPGLALAMGPYAHFALPPHMGYHHHHHHHHHAGPAQDATYEELLELEDVKVTASAKALKRLHRCTWGAPDAAGVRESACLVCQEDWAAGEKLACLPCGHVFHDHCVQQWLREYSNKCPVCKAGLK
jgi:Ring finger domain